MEELKDNDRLKDGLTLSYCKKLKCSCIITVYEGKKRNETL